MHTADLNVIMAPAGPALVASVDGSEIVACYKPDQVGSEELAFGPGIVGGVGPVVDGNLDIEIDLDDPFVGLVDYLGELDAGRDHHPIETGVERIGPGAGIGVGVRKDH